ncbi:MAG: hypothetical protein IJL97_04915, partial [Lachnospiraceae bacterium]|nr:hypothetical protein [Lachnospiraceae bacterium]
LPEDTGLGDGRVYICLENAEGNTAFEAFPIYERKLMGKDGLNGYSAIISKDEGLTGQYKVYVITGEYFYDGGIINL